MFFFFLQQTKREARGLGGEVGLERITSFWNSVGAGFQKSDLEFSLRYKSNRHLPAPGW